ncbi:helix-turn-helix transcriptional regulator [Rubinisphaera sp. JC750]|uniref:helix-turn-helix transcriptional regulator n=1 Tax=Rubinisphaera sp. JC750 TaxID=2898658 RepID=UPI001F3111DA|nr:hypothetical protein [Rubinisphaera sp. JC750]
MNAKSVSEFKPKAAITVSEMCRQLGFSRSQFYWHVRRGTFHSPLKLSNGRPYYNASMVEDNLRAREMSIGVNGEYVLFYERSESSEPAKPEPKPKQDHTDLIEGLQALGLININTAKVNKAVEFCFPTGTAGCDENDILRTVFKHLKRAEAA